VTSSRIERRSRAGIDSLDGLPGSTEGTKALVTAAVFFLVVSQVLYVDMSKDTCFMCIDNIGREGRRSQDP
jgi:hypothetical protein